MARALERDRKKRIEGFGTMARVTLRVSVIVALAFVAGCRSKSPDRATRKSAPALIRVGFLPYLSNAPLMIAMDEGYFRDEGLDVQLVPNPPTLALAHGDIDANPNILTTSVLTAVARGAEIRIVADKGYNNPAGCTGDAFIVRSTVDTDDLLDSPRKLRELRFSWEPFTEFEFLTTKLLHRAGLSLDEVTNVDVPAPSIPDAFARGSIDVRVSSEPGLSRVTRMGVAKVLLPLQDLDPNGQFAVLSYGSRLLHDPTLGQKFMDAYLRGIHQYLKGKTARNVEIIARWTHLDPGEIRSACWTSIRPDGSVNLASIDDFARWAYERHYVDTLLDHTTLWDGRFVAQARRSSSKGGTATKSRPNE